MRVYHAAVYSGGFGMLTSTYARLTEPERVLYGSAQNLLESYHYCHRQRVVDAIRADGKRIFLDSGAFSAYMQGVVIDLGKFCDYIHQNADIILMASVLDSIGDPVGTWRNQEEMERRGVRPLPCYHYGEPTEVVDHYAANYDYITIGGMVPITSNQLKIWLDRIWEEHLCNADGTAKVKVHGFGLTSPELMTRYPWYSVDSSTWQAVGSNGSIILPRGNLIAMSSQAAQVKSADLHIDNVAPPQRDAIEAMVRSHGGDPELMRGHYSHRWAWNMWALPEVARLRGHCRQFAGVERRLF